MGDLGENRTGSGLTVPLLGIDEGEEVVDVAN